MMAIFKVHKYLHDTIFSHNRHFYILIVSFIQREFCNISQGIVYDDTVVNAAAYKSIRHGIY